MKVKVKKTKMSRQVIETIAEIDKEFYPNLNLSWYLDRYCDKNEIFLLNVNDKIVGYFLFVEISQNLFNDIYNLKYDDDYNFPIQDLNVKSGYFYMPSVFVQKRFRQFAIPLLRRLYVEVQTKEKLIVITVSKEGKRMASKFLTFVGVANKRKNICVYAKS